MSDKDLNKSEDTQLVNEDTQLVNGEPRRDDEHTQLVDDNTQIVDSDRQDADAPYTVEQNPEATVSQSSVFDSTDTTEPRKSKKWLAWVIGAVVVLGGGGAAYYFLNRDADPNANPDHSDDSKFDNFGVLVEDISNNLGFAGSADEIMEADSVAVNPYYYDYAEAEAVAPSDYYPDDSDAVEAAVEAADEDYYYY